MYEDYTYNATFDPEELRGGYAILGVDLSSTTDMTAVKAIVIKPESKIVYVMQQYFIPERKLFDSDDKSTGAKYEEWAKDGYLTIHSGNEVEVDKVADWIYSLYEKYNIQVFKCGYDVRLSKSFVNRMTELFGSEILEVIPQASKFLSEPTKLLEADLKARLVNYNNNPIDRWCFSNAQIKLDQFGRIMIIKIQEQASRRIDGAVALIIAYATLRMYKNEYNEIIQGTGRKNGNN